MSANYRLSVSLPVALRPYLNDSVVSAAELVRAALTHYLHIDPVTCQPLQRGESACLPVSTQSASLVDAGAAFEVWFRGFDKYHPIKAGLKAAFLAGVVSASSRPVDAAPERPRTKADAFRQETSGMRVKALLAAVASRGGVVDHRISSGVITLTDITLPFDDGSVYSAAIQYVTEASGRRRAHLTVRFAEE